LPTPAALVSCLDLVIAVDTSVRPSRRKRWASRPGCLLPNMPDFRWLLGRGRQPLVPDAPPVSGRLRRGEYDSVIERVRGELIDLTKAFRSYEVRRMMRNSTSLRGA